MSEEGGIVGVFGLFWDLIISPLLTLLMGIATLLFFYGLIQYLGGDLFSTKKEGDTSRFAKGKQNMLYGIIGLAIMAAASPIVRTVCLFFVDNCTIGV